MKVMIACGGTGGHLFPGLAVAETLLSRSHSVTLLVSEKAVDREALRTWMRGRDSTRCASATIGAVGLNSSRQWISFCSRLARAVRECGAVIEQTHPDVVLGMGGFTSAPAIAAARWYNGRDTMRVIHESNAVPGKANRWVGRWVEHVAVGVPECAAFFARDRVTVTGTPVRSELRNGQRIVDARARLGLEPDRMTILVAGGSQGAQALNEAIVCALPWLESWTDQAQFVHLSGERDEDMVREAYERNGFKAAVMNFCHEMKVVYSAASVVIARAGAATLSEIAAFGLPSILVPLPSAAGNHQWHNARVFERAGAAQLMEQTALSTGHHAMRGERLAEVLGKLLGDDAARAQRGAAAQSLHREDAADRMVELLEKS